MMINYMSALVIISFLVQQREGNSGIMSPKLTTKKPCQVLPFSLPHLLSLIIQIDTQHKVKDHLL